MASVVPGYSFTSAQDPITYAKLNLIAQPTVTLGAGEVGTANIASNISISGLTIAANTPLIGSASTESFSGTITLTISTAKGNSRIVACTGSTASTINASAGGTAGQELFFLFSTDGTGGNVITYGTNFKSIGTHTLTGASKNFTSHFVSNGTNWLEVARSAALS